MDLIQTGKIINTHGIKGEVKVESWAQTPEVLLQLKTFFIDSVHSWGKLADEAILNHVVICVVCSKK